VFWQLYKVLNIQETSNNLCKSEQSKSERYLNIIGCGFFIFLEKWDFQIEVQVVGRDNA
jgi:hypothetical protein